MLHGSTIGSSTSASSSSPWCDGVPAIFLSHSGKQKPFVEDLYDALKRVNHFAFFDTISLPIAEKFPEHIKTAARECKVGVVVLSEDFVTSKWPMIELEILVQQRGPHAKVLPLFYKLSPNDLRNEENLSRWRRAWEKFRGDRDVDVVKWEAALKAVRAFNGKIFTPGTRESLYIDTVVRNLCEQLPSPLLEDLSTIQGLPRLAEEVTTYFNDARQCDDGGALLVGLHGVGGLGKTTICKIMANSYSVQYPGRCHHLEFPTMHGEDMMSQESKKARVQECKKALKHLTNLKDEFLNEIDNLDQVIGLMKRHLSQLDVFLAIDNVWEDSSDAVKRILEVGFSANSKILLTSRSEQILKDLLDERHGNVCVRQLPCVNYDEAFQIFQDAFGKDDIDFLESCRDQVDRIIRKFLFDGDYHALALKALGGYVRKGCMHRDVKENKEFLSCVIEQIRNEDLGSLEKVLRIGYDSLPEFKKHMFLDIAVMMPMLEENWYCGVEYSDAHQLLSILYKDQASDTRIKTLINELAQDALVQWDCQGKEAGRTARVHDLYSDIALREAATSSRFFICGKSRKPLESIEWENLERVVLGPGEDNTRFIKKAQKQACEKLQVLCAAHVNLLTGIDIRSMPSLRVLHLTRMTLTSIKNFSAASRLGFVFLSDVRHVAEDCVSAIRNWGSKLFSYIRGAGYDDYFPQVLSLDSLIELQALHLERCHDLERIQGLDSLKNLKSLLVRECRCLENLDGLSALPRLKVLQLKECEKVTRLPDLSRLTCLEELVLDENENLEEVDGVSPPALKSIRICSCKALKSTPDLSGSTVLESLELRSNRSMKEVKGVLSSSLTDLAIARSSALGTGVDITGLTRLDKLMLDELMMEDLGAVSSSVSEMRISYCRALKRMPDLSGLTRLAVLELEGNYQMEEVGCLTSTLRKIAVVDCGSLKKIPDISGLTCLQRLCLDSNGSMEEVGGQYVSNTLEILEIMNCERMQRFPSLKDCALLREVAVSPDTIAHVASSAPPYLCKLILKGGEWLAASEQWKSYPLLQELCVERCDASRIDLACLSPLMNLKSLKLHRNSNLKEIANLGKLKGLQHLQLAVCPSVEKLDGFGKRDFQSLGGLGLNGVVNFQRRTSDDGVHVWSMEEGDMYEFLFNVSKHVVKHIRGFINLISRVAH